MASFSNDTPNPRADFIGVSEEADAFECLIASRILVPPLAIGLFGNWGSGKSFLMAKVRERVSQLTTLAPSDGDSTAKEIWAKVVPIEFNAWQYFETDLWAALLSRIFDELSPEARRKLTELSRQQQEKRAQKDENLREQMRAESAVADLLVTEQRQVLEAQAAAEQVERVKWQVTRHSVLIDAAELPSDTIIRAHLANGVLSSVNTDIPVAGRDARFTTLEMDGGRTGVIKDVEIGGNDSFVLTLSVDFSFKATHLRRYPVRVQQTHHNAVVGSYTIELTAVKDLEDFFFGNRRSGELHVSTCPLWPRINKARLDTFERIADAQARGYNGCRFCLPEADTG
jgi:KAP family P-loop domain